jgi:CO/xanthine dehydrogenase FAD-binding subunit
MVAYYRAATLEDALSIRAEKLVTVLAGGTDVYPAKAARVGWGDMRQPDILDISAVSGLRGIAEDAAGWRIGALTTWTDLIRAELPPLFDGLKLAAREVGGVQIQNRGTLAGQHLHCLAGGRRCAQPAGARPPASSWRADRAARGVPMRDFIDGYRHTQCRADEIVTAILVPKPRAPRAAISSSSARADTSSSLSSWWRASSRRTLPASSHPRGWQSGPARPCPAPPCSGGRFGCAAVADGCGRRGGVASRGSVAHRRHPRVGRLPARGGAGADARSSACARRTPTAEGRLMQERVPQSGPSPSRSR